MSSIFIGRLPPYDFDDRDLKELFDKFGRITDVKLKRGHNYGFGFITYKYKEDAYDAIEEMHGKTIGGIGIVVEKKFDNQLAINRKFNYDYCFNCGSSYHFARDCPAKRYCRDDDYCYKDSYRSRCHSRLRSPYDDRRRGRRVSRSPSRSSSRRRVSRGYSPPANNNRNHSSSSNGVTSGLKSFVYYYKK